MDINNHPCFNAEIRHKTGRIHLPVAPKCNVQCNFCNRKFDCTNESRPGVSTAILKPSQALDYLDKTLQKISNLSVVGIAGPGDPFANAEETMETLELVHAQYPDKLLCISSNGLSLLEYIPRLAELKVSHVTITVNAVDPKIGAEIYDWIYFNKKTYFGLEGANLLLQRQTEAIKLLKHYGIIVKINTVVVPRVNEHHVHEIAQYVAKLGADVQNCIPLIPVEGTPFGKLEEPSSSSMRAVRAKTSMYIKQMSHCARCRADAVGLLGENNSVESEKLLTQSKKIFSFISKPYIAVSSTDGIMVDQHLGEAFYLWIYGLRNGKVELIEKRSIASTQNSNNRWNDIANILSDCSALLVNGIGQIPFETLKKNGLFVEAVSGLAEKSVGALFFGKPISKNSLRLLGYCGVGGSCSGTGAGSGCL
jgi:nitrogen fixation protein NifB